MYVGDFGLSSVGVGVLRSRDAEAASASARASGVDYAELQKQFGGTLCEPGPC